MTARRYDVDDDDFEELEVTKQGRALPRGRADLSNFQGNDT